MLDEAGLRAALERLLPKESVRRQEFVVRDASGRMRIGVLCTDAGVYAEVSNFSPPPRGGWTDYVSPWAEVAGAFRFACEVDLFYSDITQTMAMSRAAAERALAA